MTSLSKSAFETPAAAIRPDTVQQGVIGFGGLGVIELVLLLSPDGPELATTSCERITGRKGCYSGEACPLRKLRYIRPYTHIIIYIN